MTEFLELNDDCVIQVLNHCELETLVSISQTCKRLKSVVEQFYFAKITSLDVSQSSSDESIIKCVGRHIRKLSVTFDDRPFVNSNDFCKFLVQHVRDIRELKITSDGEQIPSLQLLSPILNQLDVLNLSFNREAEDVEDVYWPNNKTYTEDLALLCPNLAEFTYSGMPPFPPNCTSFGKLKSLTVSTVDGRRINSFLDKNPQITQIDFRYIDGAREFIDFDDFTQKFASLKELDISMKLIQNWSWSPQMFGRLQNLEILRLTDVLNSHNGILESLRQLKQLTTVSLCLASRWGGITTVICQHTLVRLARELQSLQYLTVWQPLDKEVSWDRGTVYDFVRHASKLKVLYVQHLNFEIKTEFIRNLVDARKSFKPNGEPLVIGADDNNFYPVMKVNIYIHKLIN